MHKRRKRELTEYERQRQRGVPMPFLTRKEYPLDPMERDEIEELTRLKEQWDAEYAGAGEGPARGGGTYRWVRVTDDHDDVLATFFIRVMDNEVQELFLVAPQRGLPPNPYVLSPVSRVRWPNVHWEYDFENDEFIRSRRAQNPHNDKDTRPFSGVPGDYAPLRDESEYAFSGLWDAKHNAGQRAVTTVMPLPTTDGDTQFRFHAGTDGFTVRGSKLGPALYAIRNTGTKYVTLQGLRLVLERM